MTPVRPLLLLLLAGAGRGSDGSPACAECHRGIYAKQTTSRHARALRPFAGSILSLALQANPAGEKDGYQFTYTDDSVAVARKDDRVTAKLDWAFGDGSLGFTAVGQFGGRYFEHRVSYFVAAARPGITPGQSSGASRSAIEALGLFKTPVDARGCFDCHSTGLGRDARGGPDLSTMTPGVHCERCHGPGAAHIAAAHANRPAAEIRQAVFNAARLPAKASIEVCGGCHRAPKPGDRSLTPERDDPVSVRFQPIGLIASRCFREGAVLTCMTCHDPHVDAVRSDPAFYAEKCLRCHASSKAIVIACKRDQRRDCLPCHMRRGELMPYLAFTDHRIRIYK